MATEHADNGLARPVAEQGLLDLSSRELIHIGSHTLNHVDLAEVSDHEQRCEIAGGRNRLEQLLGIPVEDFSYPYGHMSDQTRALVQEAGLNTACTVRQAAIRSRVDCLLLPRLSPIGRNANTFARWLDQWFVT